MKTIFTKILLFIVTSTFLFSCNAVKKVGEEELLLTNNTITANGEKINSEVINSLLYQKPNSGWFPLRLHIYNLARNNRDSLFNVWLNEKPKRKARLIKRLSAKQLNEVRNYALGFNRWLRQTGEAPVIIDDKKIAKTETRLKSYYNNKGYFNAEVESTINPSTKKKRADIHYEITTGNAYFIDSIETIISSPQIDSVYQLHKNKSRIKANKQYDNDDFTAERDRLDNLFKNSGFYNFQKKSIQVVFYRDTIPENKDFKMETELRISDQTRRTQESTITVPYKIHTVKRVNIFTDADARIYKEQAKDSLTKNNYHIYYTDKLRFRPKALTAATFIKPNEIFKESNRSLTSRAINNLQNFKYPSIEYRYIDSTGTNLEANIYLQPRKRFSARVDFDISHSDIQDFGISFLGALTARNVFRGAETMQLSLRSTLGSTNDPANGDNRFFNISEVGGDIKIDFPRMFLPFNSEKTIPAFMLPTTQMTFGVSVQENIGLDRQSFSGILRYNWKPNPIRTNNFDLINIQFVNNKNISNYFNVYQNSYNELNGIAENYSAEVATENLDADGNLIIPSGTTAFITNATNGSIASLTSADLKDINAIDERKTRLTENNLIFASSFTYTKNNRENFLDNNFSRFKTKLEIAGNLLATGVSLANIEKVDGQYRVFDVAFSQYVKTEFDYVKHWRITSNTALAFRSFLGIAIPYGNSTNIPFSRSYFAGGSNDNRAWQAYSLGPGSSGGPNEFNEANLKLALNLEYRFNIFGNFNGALFTDAGNIWNVLDDVEDEASTFNGFSSVEEIALGAGFGIRYDLSFVVLRFDIGFKAYDPAALQGERWFKKFNFSNNVFNIGINYPF